MAREIARRKVIQGMGATVVMGVAAACGDDRARPGPGEDTGTPTDSRGPGEDTGTPTDSRGPGEDSASPGRVPREQLSVLYISADELNPRFLGHEGHPDAHTPRLDALAAGGAALTRVYATAPSCAPTRQSLLSGLHPLEHGQFTNSYVFHELHTTLPERLTEAGFATACFGKLHTQNDEETYTFGFQTSLGTHSGARWDEVVDRVTEGVPWPSVDPDDEALFHEMPFDFGGKPLDDLERSDDWILVQEAIAWLRAHAGERFFLYVSLRAPHYPFDLPRDLYYQYSPDQVTLPTVTEDDLLDSPAGSFQHESQGWGEMTEAHTRLVLARYLGAVSWVDRLVGMLLDELDALGLQDSTLVAFTSDHGDMCGEKGLWLKNVFFEPALRVPFLLRVPGWVAPGSRDALLLSQVDLWPTVAGLVGAADALSGLDLSGQDRSDLLLGGEGARPAEVFATLGAPDASGLPWASMICTERHKLVRYRGYTTNPDAYELYDLEQDPEERTSLHADPEAASIRQTLEAALDAWHAGLRPLRFDPRTT